MKETSFPFQYKNRLLEVIAKLIPDATGTQDSLSIRILETVTTPTLTTTREVSAGVFSTREWRQIQEFAKQKLKGADK